MTTKYRKQTKTTTMAQRPWRRPKTSHTHAGTSPASNAELSPDSTSNSRSRRTRSIATRTPPRPARGSYKSPWTTPTSPLLNNSGSIYRVKFYTANRRDKETLPPCQCKFWPAIGISEHRQRDDVRPLHPAQVSERLRLNDNDYWAQADVHLAEILLYGPFDFETRRKFTGPRQKVSKETHFVAEVYWKQLEDAAQRRNVDVSDIRRLPTAA